MGDGEGGWVVVSHLLYADDTLVFCGAEEEQLYFLRCTLVFGGCVGVEGKFS